jgi:hypothetical protein
MVELVVYAVIFNTSTSRPYLNAEEVIVMPVYYHVSHYDKSFDSVVMSYDDNVLDFVVGKT